MRKMEAKSDGKQVNVLKKLMYTLYNKVILVYSWLSYKFIHSKLIPCPFGNGDVIVLKRHWPSDKVYEDFANSYKEASQCTFCSVRMFGTGTYMGDNGETVYADYIRDTDAYCKAHCSNYKNK